TPSSNPPPKRTKEIHTNSIDIPPDTHPTYPIPIAKLPIHLTKAMEENTPAREAKVMNSQPDLDCLYFQPFIPRSTANELFRFLRAELPFYRVVYFAKRGGVDVQINTPRFTTVFGVDEGCFFEDELFHSTASASVGEDGDGDGDVIRHDLETTYPVQLPTTKQDADTDAKTKQDTTEALTLHRKPNTPSMKHKYGHSPRPIPTCLQHLKTLVESATNTTYNFVLVNYYASGDDSIAFHSDDERFLGHHPAGYSGNDGIGSTIKLPLASGDMIVMKGSTQSNWLHSIPKRKGKASLGGRINITFRKAMIPAGTDNYYHYNVGTGPIWRWDDIAKEMKMNVEKTDYQA
ncbi:Oxoglutarate/iron-dependent dioxygenase, partial [Penicillium hetheringtonii]